MSPGQGTPGRDPGEPAALPPPGAAVAWVQPWLDPGSPCPPPREWSQVTSGRSTVSAWTFRIPAPCSSPLEGHHLGAGKAELPHLPPSAREVATVGTLIPKPSHQCWETGLEKPGPGTAAGEPRARPPPGPRKSRRAACACFHPGKLPGHNRARPLGPEGPADTCAPSWDPPPRDTGSHCAKGGWEGAGRLPGLELGRW